MPMDVADFAQEIIEHRLETALSQRKTLSLPFSGFCLCCGTAVGERRYCDSACRTEHEAKLRRKVINPSA